MALKKENVADAPAEEVTAATEAAMESDALEPEVEQPAAATPPPEANVNVPATPTPHAPPTVAGQGQGFVNDMAAAGFGGLRIDWTSFPTIVLDGNTFTTSEGEDLEPQELIGSIQQTKARYVLRTRVMDDDDAELLYTYDLSGDLANPESDLAKGVAEWKENDLDYDVKEYMEAVFMVSQPESNFDGQMVILQIPPTSTGRFSGYMAMGQMKGQLPSDYLTKCFCGNKVTKVKKPFHPWAFERVEG